MKGRVLVAGFATRHVAQSAARAGFEVCSVDHFCDQDLAWCTEDREQFDELEELPDAIGRIAGRHRFDYFVPVSGAEDLPVTIPLLGTPPERIAPFLDKLATQHFFETCNVPAPRLLGPGIFPAMVKPRRGGGGWRNAVLQAQDEEERWAGLYPEIPYIRQECVPGIPASVCCVTNGTEARAVAINEQILRGSGESAYGFSGSVTPFVPPQAGAMIAYAERIAAASGCLGTVGIDFMADIKTPWAIELNPRFQGTVETVEKATGCNLFALHMGACNGTLPAERPACRQYAARRILFAGRDLRLDADLSPLRNFVSDIPWPGTFFEEGQALVSVSAEGPTREAALALLDKHITTVRQYMR